VKETLPRDRHDKPYVPEQVPSDPQVLLDLMDDASKYAASGQGATAPQFDHGIRLFNQLHAHYQIYVAKELGQAHHALKGATNALRVATWWLAVITIALGAVEVFKLINGH
jgi:hypothetical protein